MVLERKGLLRCSNVSNLTGHARIGVIGANSLLQVFCRQHKRGASLLTLALGLESAQAANLDEWDAMVDTNVKGLMYCTRAALPGMVARNRGHIVNIGSVAAMYPYPGGNVYGASKAFVHQFSLNLRADLLGTAVRVTDVQPGMCAGTEFSQVRFKGDEARAAKVYEGVHALSADDVADTVHWVATRPAHMNVNVIEVMPVAQAFNLFKYDRKSG